jgi:hypothetical protein
MIRTRVLRPLLLLASAALPFPAGASGRTVWLDSLTLDNAVQGWGRPQAGRSVDGRRISIGGRGWERGFGTHSDGALVISLRGGSERFQAWVGLDEETLPSRGSAEFRVVGDGRVVWSSGVLRTGDPAVEVDVDTKGLRHLTLQVTDAGDGFAYDHADWADARFIVTGAAPRTVSLKMDELTIAPARKPAARRQPSPSGLAATPPMGWNSYDCFGDSVTEAEVLANAEYIAEKMAPHGWRYVVVDYRWYDAEAKSSIANLKTGGNQTDAFGRFIPAPNRFPSAAEGKGFRPLADKVHALGLKFGIHIMRGIPRKSVEANTPVEGSTYFAKDAADTSSTCAWNPDCYGVRGDTPAGQAWYDSLFRQYASWGVDFVKVDDLSQPYSEHEIEAIRRAIDKCGRPMVFSTSPGETPLARAEHVRRHANMWRITGDLWDNWRDVDYAFTIGEKWRPYAGPGAWPDSDMLPLGRVGIRSVGEPRWCALKKNEQVTMMTLWCILPSPLMVGGDLPQNDDWTLALLTNDEVLAVNQDPLGRPGLLMKREGEMEVWTKPLSDGSVAVAVFNRGLVPGSIRLDGSMGIPALSRIRDLWLRKDLGQFIGPCDVSVPPHGARFYRFHPKGN